MSRVTIVLLPFAALAILETIPLALSAGFSRPPISFFMVSVLELLLGGRALHYPVFYALLPQVFALSQLLLVAVVGFPLFGWAVFMMVDALLGKPVRPASYRTELRICCPQLILIGVAYGLTVLAPPLIASMYRAGGVWGNAIMLGAMVQCLFFKAALVYAIFFLRLYQASASTALAHSIRFARKRLPLTLLIVATALTPHMPVLFLIARSGSLSWNEPEAVLWLLSAMTILGIFTNFFTYASSTAIVMGTQERKQRQ